MLSIGKTNTSKLFKSILILFLAGGIFGLMTPLSKLASEIDANPIGLGFWVEFFAFILCLPITLYKAQFPRLNWALVWFLTAWGVVLTLTGNVLLFLVSEHLTASTISIIMVAEGLLVYLITSVLGIEKSSFKRLFGLVLGLIGIVVLIIAVEGEASGSVWFWMLLALGIPLGFAYEDIIIAVKMPDDLTAIDAITAVSGVAAFFLFIAAVVFDDVLLLDTNIGYLEIALLGIAVCMVVGTYLYVKLIGLAGPVFSSMLGYTVTFSGIAWSMLLLGETVSMQTWFALSFLIVGMVFVGPQEEDVVQPANNNAVLET